QGHLHTGRFDRLKEQAHYHLLDLPPSEHLAEEFRAALCPLRPANELPKASPISIVGYRHSPPASPAISQPLQQRRPLARRSRCDHCCLGRVCHELLLNPLEVFPRDETLVVA